MMDADYADACVQTSPTLGATHVQSDDSYNFKVLPAHNRLKCVAYADKSLSSTQNETPRCSRRIYPKTPVNRVKAQLPFSRPIHFSGSPMDAHLQRRIVSFPEQLGQDTVSGQIARSVLASSRTVSMPAALPYHPCADKCTLNMTPCFLAEDYSCAQVSPRTPDLPHTPSPPSTPESVEIIEERCHLPDNFLRKQAHINEDWLMWTNSPPRPIPALHGPASLPYARCPSGAEGTIIEEPSTAPGLIWGLQDGSSAPVVHRSRQTSAVSIEDNQTRLSDAIRRVPRSPPRRHVPETSTLREQESIDDDSHVHAPSHQSPSKTVRKPLIQGSGLDTHSTRVRRPLGEWTNNYDRLSRGLEEFWLNYNDVTDNGPDSSIPTNTSIMPPFSDLSNEMTLSEPHDDQCARNLFEVQDRSIYNAFHLNGSHDHGHSKGDTALNASAPIFSAGRCRGFVKSEETSFQNSNIHSPSHVRESVYQGLTRVSKRDVSQHKRLPQSFLPTPPDSTSPLWSSMTPIIVEAAPATIPATNPRTSENHGLNLVAPTASLEELSEQLRQLILQQKDLEALASLNRNQVRVMPTAREKPNHSCIVPLRTRSIINSSPASLKPEMPINLHDLVSYQTTRQSGIVATPLPPPTMVMPGISDPSTMHHREIYSASINSIYPPPRSSIEEYQAGRENALTGRRHPRSIPLTRLLEKKLASVPEETSIGSASSEAADSLSYRGLKPAFEPLPVTSRPVKNRTPTLARPRPAVANANNRTPLQPSPQVQDVGLPAERGAGTSEMHGSKQKKRQARVKLPSGSTSGVRKVQDANSAEYNDENIDVKTTGSSTATLKKRPRTYHRNAIDHAKRNAPPSMPHRKD
ncbi:hypothetical protein DFH11DRAFT_1562387 [Phellopilus nigrolimitatus]|nr:hypothetical protein DFH11DRAFT_1562387 [Phellopilus nigrolimitatus]